MVGCWDECLMVFDCWSIQFEAKTCSKVFKSPLEMYIKQLYETRSKKHQKPNCKALRRQEAKKVMAKLLSLEGRFHAIDTEAGFTGEVIVRESWWLVTVGHAILGNIGYIWVLLYRLLQDALSMFRFKWWKRWKRWQRMNCTQGVLFVAACAPGTGLGTNAQPILAWWGWAWNDLNRVIDGVSCWCFWVFLLLRSEVFSEHAGAEVTKRWFLLMRSTPGNSWKNALQ